MSSRVTTMELCGKGSRLGEGRASHGAFTSGGRNEKVTDRRGTDPWGQGSLCHNKPLKNCYYSSKDFCYLVGSEVGSLFQQVWFSMVGPFVRICVLYQLNLNSMLQNPHWQAATTPVLV